MKRSLFLGTAGAAILAGCGGHNAASRFLPSASGAAHGSSAPATTLRMVPAIADPIPQHVLAQPILGEAWRFDGAAIPSGWLPFDGRAVSKTQYSALYALIGNAPGTKPASGTFTLPKTPYGEIVAATGMQPSSPSALLRTGRDFSHATSLGKGAQRASAADAARIADAKQNARDAIAAALSPASNALLASVISQTAAGSRSVRSAIDALASQLSPAETGGVLGAYDRLIAPFNGGRGAQHANASFEAASAAFATTVTPDQASAIAERE
jgi:microcystin-dependent protein